MPSYAFRSLTLSKKKWIREPVRRHKDGHPVKVSFVVVTPEITQFYRNFIKHNQKMYKDLKYAGIVTGVIKSGVKI